MLVLWAIGSGVAKGEGTYRHTCQSYFSVYFHVLVISCLDLYRVQNIYTTIYDLFGEKGSLLAETVRNGIAI